VKEDFGAIFCVRRPAAQLEFRRHGDRFANPFVTRLSRKVVQRRGFSADSE
jgi:hypothetical protein